MPRYLGRCYAGAMKKPQPQKRNQTSLVVAPGKEPKGRMMAFRPVPSLKQKIDAAVAESGLSLVDWLQSAAIAHLERD